MRTHRRTTGTAVATLALAGLGLLGLTGCGAAGTGTDQAGRAGAPTAPATEGQQYADTLGAEEQALVALGFVAADLGATTAPSTGSPASAAGSPAAPGSPATAAPTGSAGSSDGSRSGTRRGDRRRALSRELLRHRVLHTEAVVRTKNGVRTIVSQRGTITAIDGTSVTVKSADGFTLTWTYGKDPRVVERRHKIQPTDLVTGAEIGVAGTKTGAGAVARLIVRNQP